MEWMEWDGPVPIETDDENTVVINEVNNILSTQEIPGLEEQLSRLNPTRALCEDILIDQFITAKMFIHSVYENHNN